MQSLETFRDRISQRVGIIDDQISDINEDLDNRIQRDVFEELLSFFLFFFYFESILSLKMQSIGDCRFNHKEGGYGIFE